MKDQLTVRVPENKGPKNGSNSVSKLSLERRKPRDISIVCHDPASKLERMAVDGGQLSLGGFSNVSEHGLRRDDTADSLEEGIVQCGAGGFDDVWGSSHVVPDSPPVRMLFALDSQGVVCAEQRIVDVAL